MKWIGRLLAEIWPFEIIPKCEVGRWSVVGRWSPVSPQYILLLTLISYTLLRYVRARSKNLQQNLVCVR